MSTFGSLRPSAAGLPIVRISLQQNVLAALVLLDMERPEDGALRGLLRGGDGELIEQVLQAADRRRERDCDAVCLRWTVL